MSENTIKIVMPELVEALNRVAEALGGSRPYAGSAPVSPAAPAPVPPAAAAAVSVSPAAPAVAAAVPVQAIPAVPVAAAVPSPAAPPSSVAVPLAAPRAYTRDEIARAGAALIDAGKKEAVLALLNKYNVQFIGALDPAQYGAFATDLRGLGADI